MDWVWGLGVKWVILCVGIGEIELLELEGNGVVVDELVRCGWFYLFGVGVILFDLCVLVYYVMLVGVEY